MKIFLSYVLDENTPTYGARDKFTITPNSQIVDGVGANTSTWSFSNNHMGTHMDTPYHFIESGKRTIDYSAEDFYFDNVSIISKRLKCSPCYETNRYGCGNPSCLIKLKALNVSKQIKII